MLRELCGKRDIGVTVVAAQQDGEVYSSTRIRSLLEAGNIAEANRILGRPWEIVGAVEHGDKRGRELSYPTANVALSDFQNPKFGLNAVRCMVDGQGHDGVSRLGFRPPLPPPPSPTAVRLED